MTEEIKKLYDERVNRFVTTSNLKEPDRVPIMASAGSWAIANAGYTYAELLGNYDLEAEVSLNAHKGFYFDGIRGSTPLVNHAMLTNFELGSKQMFLSSNGVSLQHHETSSMEADEYDEFIADPFKFIANKISVRKLSAFQADDEEEVYQSMVKLFQTPGEVAKKTYAFKAIHEQLGLPAIAGGSNIVHPFDQFFDFVRGFEPTMTDLRRRPDKVLAAVEAMTPYQMRNLPKEPLPEFPWRTDNHHIAKFLTKDLFGKFYWPYYKAAVEALYNCGTKLLSHFEGPWVQHYDYLQELPKTSLICILENDEVEYFKQRFADQFTIFAAISGGTLRIGDIERCKEEAKALIDIAAPGGGYIYGARNGLSAPGDADPEVLRELNKFITEYAVY
ncbi:MAG: hypothetical protein FWG10_05445 [Eubacteriaceae bacterium]|nr:hypothetical protein [Eubacteriaceae bacterium]